MANVTVGTTSPIKVFYGSITPGKMFYYHNDDKTAVRLKTSMGFVDLNSGHSYINSDATNGKDYVMVDYSVTLTN